LAPFYQEVRRVMKPGGLVAFWTYHRPQIHSDLDDLIAHLDDEILGAYWPAQVRYLQEHYQTLLFPFDELSPPEFSIEAKWTLDQMMGFINSWSATKRYEEAQGVHPLKPI
jgi:hypothetical protein